MWQIVLGIGLLIIGVRTLFKIANWIIKAMMDFTIFLIVTATIFLVIFGV